MCAKFLDMRLAPFVFVCARDAPHTHKHTHTHICTECITTCVTYVCVDRLKAMLEPDSRLLWERTRLLLWDTFQRRNLRPHSIETSEPSGPKWALGRWIIGRRDISRKNFDDVRGGRAVFAVFAVGLELLYNMCKTQICEVEHMHSEMA